MRLITSNEYIVSYYIPSTERRREQLIIAEFINLSHDQDTHTVTDSGRVRANFRFDLRCRGTYDTKGSREKSLFLMPAVQSTLCTRRDNNLLTRTCRLRKEGSAGQRGMRTGLSYECEFLSRAVWLRGWKGKKKRGELWGRTSELFVVTRIHQSLTRRMRVSNGTHGLLAIGMVVDKERSDYIAKYDESIFHILSTEYSERIFMANKI